MAGLFCFIFEMLGYTFSVAKGNNQKIKKKFHVVYQCG